MIGYEGQLGDQVVTAYCWVRKFSPDGENALASACAPFEVLSK